MTLLQFSLVAFASIFVLVDPIATVPTFLALTGDSNGARRRHTAVRAE
jgi:multiple antibiotic resistance protein